jgi:hypothetical protein
MLADTMQRNNPLLLNVRESFIACTRHESFKSYIEIDYKLLLMLIYNLLYMPIKKEGNSLQNFLSVLNPQGVMPGPCGSRTCPIWTMVGSHARKYSSKIMWSVIVMH